MKSSRTQTMNKEINFNNQQIVLKSLTQLFAIYIVRHSYFMATLADLKVELEPFKNTLVIDDSDKVVRLVDVIDGEDDYYWVYDSRKGIYYSSCVGGWIPLKGFIEQEKYDRMVRIWNLNNIDKAV